ncbi:MAG: hypothetical protein LBD02_10645 [Christensenellaceae bacterium]|jgi:hypothetical protein|nr:hypothetical protein [Christensenellaceae bacterium]
MAMEESLSAELRRLANSLIAGDRWGSGILIDAADELEKMDGFKSRLAYALEQDSKATHEETIKTTERLTRIILAKYTDKSIAQMLEACTAPENHFWNTCEHCPLADDGIPVSCCSDALGRAAAETIFGLLSTTQDTKSEDVE